MCRLPQEFRGDIRFIDSVSKRGSAKPTSHHLQSADAQMERLSRKANAHPAAPLTKSQQTQTSNSSKGHGWKLRGRTDEEGFWSLPRQDYFLASFVITAQRGRCRSPRACTRWWGREGRGCGQRPHGSWPGEAMFGCVGWGVIDLHVGL